MTTGIKDVARRAGVSSATVSRVLTDKPHVREEVRQRVLAAIKEMGYQPSRVARSLRIQRSHIIGLIISDIQNPFFTNLVRAVEDVAYEHQYAVVLCNSDEDVEKEMLYIDLMRAEMVAGVLITPTRETNSPCKKLIEAGIPVVAVDRRMLDLEVDTVVTDNVGAAFDLVSHLIVDGHQRIGGIFATSTTTTGRERQEGYFQALQEHGLPIDSSLVRMGLPKEDSGYRFAGELLDLPNPPTALFTGNNVLTTGAIRAINERRLQIPGDIALGAFDEMSWMSLIKPSLTVIAQPTYELGQTAVNLLLQRIKDRTRPRQEIVLKSKLFVRQSCAQHTHKDENAGN
jgi:DNA-binding LacI/PurR family transcriptional regulator